MTLKQSTEATLRAMRNNTPEAVQRRLKQLHRKWITDPKGGDESIRAVLAMQGALTRLERQSGRL